MEERFRFRYFNKLSKKMVYPTTYGNIEGIYECLKQQVLWDCAVNVPFAYNHTKNGLVLMQSTGLKDKNGKLIYEGDIVKYYYEFQPSDFEIREVKWGGIYEYPAFDIVGGNFDCNGLSYIFAEGMDIEVIGNIYENSDLLSEVEG